MQKNFLKEVVSYVVGKQSENIVESLDTKKHVNEFLIAKKLDLTVNQVRNILYKLSEKGVVSYVKKKDKRKGWYTFFWKLEPLKALKLFEEILVKRINELKSQIKSRETKLFYVCNKCNIEFNEENALANDFTCQECGNVFELKDNSKVVKDYKKELANLENTFEEIKKEISIEEAKLEKISIKKAKKEKEERSKKLKKAKAKRDRTKSNPENNPEIR